MKPQFILFDMDNTLYPADSGLLQEMNSRIIRFAAEHIGVNTDEAHQIRKTMISRYGSSLRWLSICYGLHNFNSFVDAVHPKNVENYVRPDSAMKQFLDSLDLEYALLTNSPLEHTRRVLSALELEDYFPRIWDIRRLGFCPKPYRSAYNRVLGDLGLTPQETLLVDDNEGNIIGFQNMGGQGFHVPEKSTPEWTADLQSFLEAGNPA